MRKPLTLLGISLTCLLLDQVTKYLFWNLLREPLHLLPFLDFTKAFNKGFVFGLFQHSEGLLKTLSYYGVPLLIVALLLWGIFRVRDTLVGLGFALILGGGLGNLLDRLLLGGVRDFIDFHIGDWHYPTFNVADICVSLGILLLLAGYLKGETKRV